MSNNKVKVLLSLITIALTVGPLLGVVYVYRDNLVGIIMPPETAGQFSITNSDIANLNFTALEEMNPIEPLCDPTLNMTTGNFIYDLNLTNPLPQEISIDNISVDVKTADGQFLGTIGMPQGLHLESGESGVIDISGNLNPELLESYKAQAGSNAQIALDNITLTVGGISFHLDELPGLGNIPLNW